MASKEAVVRTMLVPGSAAAGAKVYVGDLGSCTLVLNPTSADYTVQFEGSLDGTNWFNIGSTQADASAPVAIDVTATIKTCSWVRARVTEWTSGSGTACVTGQPLSL